MARFIVTGGSGFIGQALASVLETHGHEVVVASRGFDRHRGRAWVEYDLQRPETISNLIALQPDGVFHLAWSTVPASAEHTPEADVRTNVVGSIELFRALSEVGVRTVFLSSGGTVYGVTESRPIFEEHPTDPIGAYGMSKLVVEQYAELFRRSHHFDVRIARLSNPYGINVSEGKAQGAVSIFARRIISNDEIVLMGDGSVVRDYIEVNDAAHALYLIMLAELGSNLTNIKFNVGTGKGLSLTQVISLLEDITGARARVRRAGERKFDVPYNVLDISKMNKEIRWQPRTDIRDGIEELVRTICEAKKNIYNA
jgi:UDP-glucose 4-epimerase